MRVHCPATEAEPCRGRVLLEVDDAVSLRVGARRFAVAAGATQTLAIRVATRVRRVLRRVRRLRVLATARSIDAAGNEATVTARFRLRVQGRPKRSRSLR